MLNAMAFANVGNFREFEELLEISGSRIVPEKPERRAVKRQGVVPAKRARRAAASQSLLLSLSLSEALPKAK